MIICAVSLAAGVSAAAQNLDPTVVVNRAYEGKLLEVHKPVMEMAVPDTVRQFDLEFDYSVFENPYMGSYDFRPYQLLMKPSAAVRDFNTFWLRAGAGYTLYPELGLVWTPAFDGRFKMNVYADYNAYVGGYRGFRPDSPGDGVVTLSRWENQNRMSTFWNGYRMKSRAGVDGRFDLKNAVVSFDLAYYGIASKDTLKRRSYDSFDMKVNVASRPSGEDYFMYDVTAAYRFGEDKLKYKYDDGYVSENMISVGAMLGPVFAKSHKVLFDVGVDAAFCSGSMRAAATELTFAPHYVFSRGRLNLDLGLRLAKVVTPSGMEHYSAKDQIVYPDLNARYALIPDAMSIYGSIGGGNQLHTYSSILEANPFVDADYARGLPLMDFSIERISFLFGVDGRISRRFTYDVHAGYSVIGNGLLDAVFLSADNSEYVPGIGYASYNRFHAGLEWIWRTDDISFDGDVEYSLYSGLDDAYGLFEPAPFKGSVSFEYNWNRRVFAGIGCRFASARKGILANEGWRNDNTLTRYDARVPGYADLGLYGEYAPSQRLSFWLRGGNLLNMTVQHTPLYAEKGLNFTAGICLKL